MSPLQNSTHLCRKNSSLLLVSRRQFSRSLLSVPPPVTAESLLHFPTSQHSVGRRCLPLPTATLVKTSSTVLISNVAASLFSLDVSDKQKTSPSLGLCGWHEPLFPSRPVSLRWPLLLGLPLPLLSSPSTACLRHSLVLTHFPTVRQKTYFTFLFHAELGVLCIPPDSQGSL